AGARAGSPKHCNPGPCSTTPPVIEQGTEVDPGKVEGGTVDPGTGGGGADEVVCDGEGKLDSDIVVDDSPAQPGLRAGAVPQGRVTVVNGARGGTPSLIRVRGSDGQTKLVPGIRLRSAGGQPLALQQFRVSTATGQVKTVQGVRARTASGKTTILP